MGRQQKGALPGSAAVCEVLRPRRHRRAGGGGARLMRPADVRGLAHPETPKQIVGGNYLHMCGRKNSQTTANKLVKITFSWISLTF